MTSASIPVSRDSYGTLLLVLAAPALLPGVSLVMAPLAGLASLVLGLQLVVGKRVPWMPERVRSWMAASPMGPRLSLWIQERARPLLRLPAPSFPRLLAGLTVAWSSLLLVLPLVFVPFGNVVPALSLGLVGAGLVVRKSLLSWMGMALSGGYTTLLIVLGEALLIVVQEFLSRLT